MIRQREATLQSVIHTIVDLQEAFFKSGDPSAMKPMGLKDIEDITGLDISTISRVTSNKYMQTPFGMVKLKDLFNQGIGKKDGSTVNTQEVEQRIAQLIEKEDKQNPLSDQAIAEQLDTDGYIVARRTVAKYRALMHIPAAKQRQQPTTEQL
jgi:RNA polymerase sigma-54 factor